MSNGDQRFRKRHRLHLQADFDRVLRTGRKRADDVMVVYVSPNGLEWSRLGIRVGRHLGAAPRRSYLRRRIREAFRLNRNRLPIGADILCIARAGAADAPDRIASSLIRLAGSTATAKARAKGNRPRRPDFPKPK